MKMFVSRYGVSAALVLGSAVCLAQTAEPSSKPASDDLKVIRASLDRLTLLTQELDKNQKIMVSLEQMQIYESRLGVLETRDDALTQQETELNSQVSTLQHAAESGVGPTGVATGPAPDTAGRTATSQLYDTAARKLEVVRSKKQQVEGEMTTLRARLSVLEKSLRLDTAN